MAEYIDRAVAVSQANFIHGRWDDVYVSAATLMAMPAADVAPVVRGKWGTHSDRPDSLICSVCNCGFDMWKHDPHNYCPNCGAKMDGGADR